MMATVNEILRDELLTHRVYLTRFEAGVVSRLLSSLSLDDVELTLKLQMVLEDIPAGNISVKQLSRRLAAVSEVNRNAVTRFFSELGQILKDFTEYESGFGFDLMKSLLPEVASRKKLLKRVDAGQAYKCTVTQPFLGYTLKEWADKLAEDRFARIVNTVRIGLSRGETATDIARSVRGTKTRNWQDGALNTSRVNASAICYSGFAHAAAVVREQTATVNRHLLKFKQWLSTLDNKTSSPCRIRDALLYALTNEPIRHNIPWGDGPGRLHFHCRSTYTLVFKSWQEMGLLPDELSDGEKADLNGEVPEASTYAEWIGRQRASRQDDILGPSRGKLLREGGLKLTSFYTEDGKWLTLDELRQRDAAAFRRAGLH